MRSLSHTSIHSFVPISLSNPGIQPNTNKSSLHATLSSTTSTTLPIDNYTNAITKPKRRKRKQPYPNLHTPPLTKSIRIVHRFSDDTRKLLQQAISHSWATSTINKYSNAIRLFLKFCEIEKVPNSLRFPTDEFVLCAFAASGCGTSSYNTIRNKIAALKAWHRRHDTEWKGSMRLRLVMSGVKKMAPKSSRLPRLPINAKMLAQLVENLDLNNPLDAAVAACATTAFWGQCRLGELLPTASKDFRTSSIPARQNLRRSPRNEDSFLLHLPRTKTKHDGEDIVLTSQSHLCDPLKTLQNHFRVNNFSRKLPIFTYSSKFGARSLTRRLFLARCNGIWSKLGYPRTTGHTFRIGGTTELLLAGVPPDVVKSLGRWSSDSFLRYWRFLDAIAPKYCRKIPFYTRTSKKRKRQDSL